MDVRRPVVKTGVVNDILWSEIGSECGELGGTPHQEFLGVPAGLHRGCQMNIFCLFTANKIINMASNTTSYASTKETTNFARLCRLIVDVGSHALRNIFDSIHPPSYMEFLQSHLHTQYCIHLEGREFSIPLNGPSCIPLHLYPYVRKILISHYSCCS